MKDLTWPVVAIFIAVLTALVALFGLSTDQAMRQQVLGYFDSMVPLIIGAGAGAALGGAVGFAGGYAKGHSTAKEELRGLEENGRLQAESLRRAAQVVRVAAEEGHQAADEARAAVDALHTAAEEGRAAAVDQRALVAEARRSLALYEQAQRRSGPASTRHAGEGAA